MGDDGSYIVPCSIPRLPEHIMQNRTPNWHGVLGLSVTLAVLLAARYCRSRTDVLMHLRYRPVSAKS